MYGPREVTERTGQLIGSRYRLKRCLARGGMGSVWIAEHVELETDVALKLLRPELNARPADVERFRREAQQAAKLKSPHIVRIHDFGIDQHTPFIAMELLLGEDLGLRLDRVGKLPPEVALRILEQAARGLSVAHEAGIVHRDIKPANLFIETGHEPEIVKLVDFGVAKQVAGDLSTTQGEVWGSPAFMSPEQARGRAVDQRTDVWALAVVLYRMLTGSLPFSGDTEHDVIVKVCTESPTRPRDLLPGLPPAVDEFFERALARDRETRLGSVRELLEQATHALREPESDATPHAASRARALGPPSHPVAEGRDIETQPLEPQQATRSAPPAIKAEPGAPLTLPPHRSPDAQGAQRDSVPHPTPRRKAGLVAVASASATLGLILAAVLSAGRHAHDGAPPPSAAEGTPLVPHVPTVRVSPASPQTPTSTPLEEGPGVAGRRPSPHAAPPHTPTPDGSSPRAEPTKSPPPVGAQATPSARPALPLKDEASSHARPSSSPRVPPGSAPTDSTQDDQPPTDPLFGLPLRRELPSGGEP